MGKSEEEAVIVVLEKEGEEEEEELEELEDVEEGEISDSGSVEEISFADFNSKQPPPAAIVAVATATRPLKQESPQAEAAPSHSAHPNSNGRGGTTGASTSTAAAAATTAGSPSSRKWTMRDVYKYPVCSGYASGLYNLAWAQAVQNKSLDDIFVNINPPNAARADANAHVVANNNTNNNYDNNRKKKQQEPSKKKTLSNRLSSSSSSSSNSTSSRAIVTTSTINTPSKQKHKHKQQQRQQPAAKVVIDLSGSSDEIDALPEEAKEEEEKEEGEWEWEEGEIDFDSHFIPSQHPPPPAAAAADDSEIYLKEEDMEMDMDVDMYMVMDIEKQLNSIRQALENFAMLEADKSLVRVCSLLDSILERLQNLMHAKTTSTAPTTNIKDALIQQTFSAIHSLHSAFCSMNQIQKEQNKAVFLRSLAWLMSQTPSLFNPEQMKEIAAMMSSVDNPTVTSCVKSSHGEKELHIKDGVSQKDSDILVENMELDSNSSNNLLLNSTPSEYFGKDGPKMVPPGLKCRSVFGPLLDLHKDHDLDSLPSPTRESPPCSVKNISAVEDGFMEPEISVSMAPCGRQDPIMYLYETDALKAVSTYQQKFGRTSFFSTNRLPSPTPSEEADGRESDCREADASDEVSSSTSTFNTVEVVAPPIGSSAPLIDTASLQGLSTTSRNSDSMTSVSIPAIRSSAKSRDPRLRHANLNVPAPVLSDMPKVESLGTVVSSKKQRTAEDFVSDGPAMKRPRNLLANSGVAGDLQTVAGTVDQLEAADTFGLQFKNKDQLMEKAGLESLIKENLVTASGIGSTIHTVAASREQLPAIWKDIAMNPTLLMNLLKIGERGLVSEAQQISISEPAKSALSLVTGDPAVNVSPSSLSELGQKPLGKVEASSQLDPLKQLDEKGIIRMKPRDPRRILHSNTFQSSRNLVSQQLKTTEVPSTLSTLECKGILNSQKQEDLKDANSMRSQSEVRPDITRQFTENLKNIANLVSFTPVSTTFIASSTPFPQSSLDSSDVVDSKSSFTDNDRTGVALAPEEGVVDPTQSPNNWEDVEHLFEGFDDQEKAAIQKERSRRIEELKKMFAARKLCLVLDLDHTLLNSAKFGEVDPMHDEVLRRKEEQDREKPQRHLFRFSHMGMWTKLRPGIWNFLEKASQLYELHLYTMGNKLYAKEMAKVLDPTGALFAGRIIARGDDGDASDGDERVPKSKDLEGVLGMESAIVIIDDSVRVWPHNKLNLIVVERYTYFPSSRRQFGLPGPSLLEIDHDERPEEGTLASSLGVIERLHQIFFSNRSLDEVDVRNILASEQRKILGGCRILFSRVFPVGEVNPHHHPLWQTAEQFGAVCISQIDEQVTHVVANSPGTDKVNWALSTGRFVVHPGWVEASALLYRRANELDFSIKL